MASINPFDLLGDDDNDDPSQLIAAQQQKLPPPPPAKKSPAAVAGGAQPAKPAKLPSKPLPPAQAVKEARSEAPRGGRGGGRGSGRGRGAGGYNRDLVSSENTFGSNTGFSGGYRAPEEGDSGKTSERRGYGGPRTGGFRGGRRGGFNNGEDAEGERPRRPFERRSGTGRGNETKRDGAGRGNWGTPTDEIAPETEVPVDGNEKTVDTEKQAGQENVEDASKESPVSEPKEEEPEDKEMTLEEYQKVLEEKRKALLALKTEERKVDVDKELQSMQLISSKKGNDEIFVKLGSEKDKRKEAAEKEEKAKKSVSINEFLKPAEGERYPGGGGSRGSRGRGGRGGRGSRGGEYSGTHVMNYSVEAPSISDVAHFPSLGAK